MLFSEKFFFDFNNIPNISSFEWNDQENRTAKIHFSISDGHALSLPYVPYSGFQLEGKFDQNDADSLTSQMIFFLKKKKVKSITIKQPPEILVEENKTIHQAFIKAGFTFISEINHHGSLREWQSRIDPMQKRRINKCMKHNLIFNQEQAGKSDEVYSFLEKCRSQQGLTVNMGREKFCRLVSDQTEYYHMYTVRDTSDEIYACLVVIQVTNTVIYNFLPAFDRAFSTLSPLAFLYHEYFSLLEKNNISFLDFGISSIKGKPQSGLIKFKERMGGILTNRYIYKLTI